MKKFIQSILLCALIALPLSVKAEAAPSASHIWERAAYGDTPGITSIFFNGWINAITTTYRTVWPEQTAHAPLAAAMTTPYCASTDNTADAAAGTGCRTMSVSGVDTSYAEFTETVALNGQTSVTLAATNILAINKMTCLTAGSGFVNAGVVRCGTGTNTAGAPAVTRSHMYIGQGMSQSAIYTVPAGKTMLCKDFSMNSYGVTAGQSVQFVIDRYVDPVAGKVLIRENIGQLNQGGSSSYVYPGILRFVEKTTWQVNALSAASTGPVYFSANCVLITNSWENSAQTLF